MAASRGSMPAALLSLVLALAGPAGGARAQEDLAWVGQEGEGFASLHYGVPESDYVLISLFCDVESRTIDLAYLHEPADARDGVEVDVVLRAGGSELSVATVGMSLVMDDSFVLTGRLESAGRLRDLLASGGVLTVRVEGDDSDYPLDGALEAAAPLFAACAP